MRDVRKMPTTRYATCLCSRVVRKMQLGRCYTQVVGLYSRGRCRGGGGGGGPPGGKVGGPGGVL
jgi:hypothetical protein